LKKHKNSNKKCKKKLKLLENKKKCKKKLLKLLENKKHFFTFSKNVKIGVSKYSFNTHTILKNNSL